MPSKRSTKAKRAANLVVAHSAKTSGKLTSKFSIDIVITNTFKARLQGIASLARGRKSARIQGILAHGPTIHIAPNVVDQEQDELGVNAEDEPS
jgi:hypothetical protein